MKILIIGSGGREHALAWKMSQSVRVSKVYVAPGNGGTAADPHLENVALSKKEDLLKFAQDNGIAYAVVGPEAPLADGIVDLFRANGIKIFGPTKAAAQLETSKEFAKRFMARHNIPTAAFDTFSDAQKAKDFIRTNGTPIVIKADGLAAGKGVIVAMNEEEAFSAVDMMLEDNRFGDAGAKIVVEQFLEGEEASFIVVTDGEHILPLASSQDHKRLLDGDAGPNTGGMGAYSPAPVVTPSMHAKIMREIITPTVRGMKADGIPYSGFLYAGVMIAPDGTVRTLEFNCRMGDPETQPILSRLKTDLHVIFERSFAGTLDTLELDWDRRTAVGVVMAARGYPDAPEKGAAISGLPKNSENCRVFHAGTAMKDGTTVVSGGRVLCVVALDDSVRMARKIAYDTVSAIKFDGAQYRTDIAWRAMKHPA